LEWITAVYHSHVFLNWSHISKSARNSFATLFNTTITQSDDVWQCSSLGTHPN
jgi:hypothetical protein